MSRPRITVGLLGRFAEHAEDLRRAAPSSLRIQQWRPGEGQALAQIVSQCDAVVVGPDAAHGGFVALDLHSFTALKLIVLPFTGHDWLPATRLPPGCLACNTYEHEGAIAEYVMGAILHLTLRLDRLDAAFRGGDWSAWAATGGVTHAELAGRQLGLVGYGHIGRAIAERASPFGMTVAATSSRARKGESLLAWHGGPERLDELIETSDFLVLACELNDQTRGLISEARLAKMKPSAVLVNVARGGVADEGALFTALQQHSIAGAILDVWYRYPRADDPAPRPASRPFWTLDNVLMTPHCAAQTDGKEARRWASVRRALLDFANGDRPMNVFAEGAEG